MNVLLGGCYGLTSINLSDGVTSIGNAAFAGCSALTSVNLPDGVTSIGEDAFYECFGLVSVTCRAQNPPSIGTRAFDNIDFLYVPVGSVLLYKDSDWADYFKNIESIL